MKYSTFRKMSKKRLKTLLLNNDLQVLLETVPYRDLRFIKKWLLNKDNFIFKKLVEPTIQVTYFVVTEQSSINGDFDHHGFSPEHNYQDGIGFSTEDDWMINMVNYLFDNGATEPSSTSFGGNIWYSTEAEIDIHTGESKTYNYHIIGLTTEECRQIYNSIARGYYICR